jgi:hypothetical protein
MTTVLAGGLALSLGSAAIAAPIGALKQFKVPTANSQPRAITNGSDGNRWFTEGTELTSAPAKIARITPAGLITEFAPDVADGCNFCIITDIGQGPGGILYITSNDATLMRFNVATQSFETPVQMPNTSALGGNLAVSATDAWITDFNNDVVWRYHLSNGQFTSFPVPTPPTSPWTRPETPGSPSPVTSTHPAPATSAESTRQPVPSRRLQPPTVPPRWRCAVSPSPPMGRSGSPPGSRPRLSGASTRPTTR